MAKKSGSSVDEGKVCAALSYILIGIIWYFVDDDMKKNSFAKYHAKQGLVLLIAWVIYSIALGIVFGAILVPLIFTGAYGLVMIINLLYYVPFIFLIIGLVNALNGKQKELPIIGKFAKKLTF
jgi:uncharacterized membrane protein